MTPEKVHAFVEELDKINDLLLEVQADGASDGGSVNTKLDMLCYAVAALVRLESERLSAELSDHEQAEPDVPTQLELFPDLPPPTPDVTET